MIPTMAQAQMARLPVVGSLKGNEVMPEAPPEEKMATAMSTRTLLTNTNAMLQNARTRWHISITNIRPR